MLMFTGMLGTALSMPGSIICAYHVSLAPVPTVLYYKQSGGINPWKWDPVRAEFVGEGLNVTVPWQVVQELDGPDFQKEVTWDDFQNRTVIMGEKEKALERYRTMVGELRDNDRRYTIMIKRTITIAGVAYVIWKFASLM